MVSCRRKHQFYLSDEQSEKIYFITEDQVSPGRVKEDGDEITLDVLGPGEIFGELEETSYRSLLLPNIEALGQQP